MDNSQLKADNSNNPDTVTSVKAASTTTQPFVAQYGLPQKNYPIEDLEVHEQGTAAQASQYTPHAKLLPFSHRKAVIVSIAIALVVTLFTGASILILARKAPKAQQNGQSVIQTQDLSLKDAEIADLPAEIKGAKSSLFVNGDIITSGSLKVVNSGFAGTLSTETLTANQTYTLPNASGTFCLSTNNCDLVTNEDLAAVVGLINQPDDVPASSLLNGMIGGITLQGTGNQIIVTNSNGVITLSTPQDIGITSSPTFASATLSGNLNIGGTLTLPINCTVFLNGGSLTTNNLGQVLCTNDESSGAGSSVTTAGGTPGTIPMFTSADVIGDSLLTQSGNTISVAGNLSAFGNGLFRSTVDSTNVFQVQNSASNSVLNVSTVYDTYTNLINNGTFESDTPGVDPVSWVTQEYPAQAGTPDINTNSDVQYVHTGSRSMRVTTTNNTGDGATIPVITQVNSSYVLSMWIMAEVGTPSINDIVIGHQLLGGGQFALDCTISKATQGSTAAPRWSQFVCSFTTNITHPSHNIHVRRTNSAEASGVNFYVDDVRLHQTVGNKVQIGSIGTSGTDNLGQLQFAYDGGGSITLQSLIGSGVTGNYILTLPTESGVICTTSNSSPCSTGNDGRYLSKIIQDTATVAVPNSEYLYTFRNSSSALTGGVLDINNGTNTGLALQVTGKIGVSSGSSTPASDATFGDLSFGGNSGITRTINQLKPTTLNANGGILRVKGAEGNGTGTGGTLTLLSGAAGAGGNGNGGTLNIETGRRDGTGTDGDINIRSDNVVIRTWTDNTQALNVTNAAGTSLVAVDSTSRILNLLNNTDFIQTGSGTFTTGTGNTTLNGDVTLNADFNQTGTNTFSTGTGAVSLDGATTVTSSFIQTGAGTFGTGAGAVSLNGPTTAASTFSVTGLTSLNGGLTVQAGDAFTFNSDAFTDLTGTGLQISGGALQTTLGTDINLTTEVTGILPVLNGGTGALDATSARSNLSAAASGANSDITSLTALTAITPSGALTIGATGQVITIQGNASSSLSVTDAGFTATLNFAAPTSNYAVLLPDAGGNDTLCLENLGNCAGSGGGVTGAGTNNQIAKFTSTGSTVGDSTLTDDGVNVTTSVGLIVQGGSATLGAALQAGSLIISDGSSNTATIVVAPTTGDYTYTIPDAGASDDFCLFALQNCSGSGGGNAPTNAEYFTFAPEAGLSAERTLSFNGTNFNVSDGGPNGAYSVNTIQNINTVASPSFAGLAIAGTASIQGSNSLSLGTANGNIGSILFYASGSANGITLRGPTTPGAGLTLTLPNETGTLCSTGSVCSGYAASTGAAGYIQNGTSTQSSANFKIQSASASSVGGVIQGATSQTADLFQLTNSLGSKLLGVDAAGNQESIGSLSTPNGGFGSYSNLISQSESLDDSPLWSTTNLTVTGDDSGSNPAPNGQTSAEKLVSTSINGTLAQTYATSITGNYTFSVWVKTNSGTATVNLRIDTTGGSPVTGTASSFTATTTWQRFYVTQNTSGGVSAVTPKIILPNSSTTVAAWGAQLVKDTVPQVYVQNNGLVAISPRYGAVSNGNLYLTGDDVGYASLTIQKLSGFALEVVDANGTVLTSINSIGTIYAPTITAGNSTLDGSGLTFYGSGTATIKGGGGAGKSIIIQGDIAPCFFGCGVGGSVSLLSGDGSTGGTSGDININVGDNTFDSSGSINIGTINSPLGINIGASSGSNLILNDAEWSITGAGVITTSGQINANSGTIATNQIMGVLFNTTSTTINAFGAATTINLGANATSTINLGSTAGFSDGTKTIQTLNQTTNISSANLTLKSGNASGGGSGNSGNINIDVGTASGTVGSINIGATNATAINFGTTVNYVFAATENIDIDTTTGTSALGIIAIDTTPTANNANTRGIYIRQINSSAHNQGLDNVIEVDNAETGTAISSVLTVTNSGITGGYTNIFDIMGMTLNATELGLLNNHDVALVDTNDGVATAITGTGVLNAGSISNGFGAIDIGSDNFTGAIATLSGDLAVNGGNITSTTTLNINASTTINLQDNTNIAGNLDVSGTLFAGTADAFQVNASGKIVAVVGITSSGDILPSTAEGITLGSAAYELDAIYLGDGLGLVLGIDQDAYLGYDELTDDRVELTGTGASLFIEDRLGLGVQALNLTDDGTANDTLAPTASYVRVDADETGNGGVPDLSISEASAKDGDMLIIVNNEQDATNDTFTITNSAGVVQLPGGANITLGPNDSITLIYMSDRWITLSSSNN